VSDAAPAWASGDGSATDRLTLADWRRRVAELYVEVRAMARTDPQIAHAHWRAVRERLFREHPQSPVPAADRADFRAIHYPYDPAWRFVVALQAVTPPDPDLPSLSLPNSGQDTLAFRRVGVVELPLPVGPRRLAVYWLSGYAGGLFLPFRDATNGTATYGAGRYLLDAAKSHDLGADETTGELVIDANFATQPSCAFDPKWACPLAPPENRLDVAIEAGERLA